MTRVQLTFGARALVGANDGLDAGACAARYAELVCEALCREWPDAEIDVAWSDDRAATRVAVHAAGSLERARGIERAALDLAWVVRQMGAWAA